MDYNWIVMTSKNPLGINYKEFGQYDIKDKIKHGRTVLSRGWKKSSCRSRSDREEKGKRTTPIIEDVICTEIQVSVRCAPYVLGNQ
ncbi:uncharacterized protein LOC142665320 isoform X2 [Rhinoderma darwinii]|uniref:uncharacterized protein LOC142665320 isoform X2 n=1 Tax=Rhinoderma darwinii TaxID=43563 RepID=UPI003F669D36